MNVRLGIEQIRVLYTKIKGMREGQKERVRYCRTKFFTELVVLGRERESEQLIGGGSESEI